MLLPPRRFRKTETLERIRSLFTSDRVVVAAAAAVEAASAGMSVEQVSEIVTALDEELAFAGAEVPQVVAA